MRLEELTTKIKDTNQTIKSLLQSVGYEYEEYLESVQIDEGNPDEVQLMTEYMRILKRLDEVVRIMDYIHQPIANEGTLHMNQNGRYEFDGIELKIGRASCRERV